MTGLEGGQCWNCSNVLSSLYYGRSDTCPKCGRDTRVCRGCVFYDRASNNECREPQADRVLEKERSNFCDYFRPSSKGGTAVSSKDQLKSAAEALFKKKS